MCLNDGILVQVLNRHLQYLGIILSCKNNSVHRRSQPPGNMPGNYSLIAYKNPNTQGNCRGIDEEINLVNEVPPELDFYKISHNYVNIVQPSSIAPRRQWSKSALRFRAGDHFHSSITFFSLPWSNPPFSNPYGSSRPEGNTLDQRQVSENSDSFVYVKNNER